MIRTFLLSFKLKNTYRTNIFIHSLKQVPFLKKIISNKTYKSNGLKVLGMIFSILKEITSIFFGKLLYIYLMIFLPLSLYSSNNADVFVHIILFLTIIGAYFNTFMFNPTRDKYYAIFLMRMNAKEYTISNYAYDILKTIIGFLPFCLLFGILSSLNIFVCLLIPIFIASIKIILSTYFLNRYEKKKIINDENHPPKWYWVATGILLLIAYGLPIIWVIPVWGFILFAAVSIIVSIFCIRYILNFTKYREIYKIILSDTNMNMTEFNKNNTQLVRETTLKNIDSSVKVESKKTGFAYFNEIFVKRHRKLLLQSAKRMAGIALVVVLIFIGISIFDKGAAKEINKSLLTLLPYFAFIMYVINRGQGVTQAMFMNCDHSMFSYGLYKNPSNILVLFKERLKTLVSINLIPAIVIALGLPLVLFFSGGSTNFYDYLILFFSITSMSIFFSVHHLVIYYLLQPYTINSETKGVTFKIVSGITYFMCYILMQLRFPIFFFGIAAIVFCLGYFVVSLMLVYYFANKTFKIRL